MVKTVSAAHYKDIDWLTTKMIRTDLIEMMYPAGAEHDRQMKQQIDKEGYNAYNWPGDPDRNLRVHRHHARSGLLALCHERLLTPSPLRIADCGLRIERHRQSQAAIRVSLGFESASHDPHSS